jgi:MFS family permease
LISIQVGPQRWLSFQIVSWGLVATFQSFAKNYAGFLVTRILLGLCEAGFIPGGFVVSVFGDID